MTARPLVLIVLSGGPRGGVVEWCNFDPDLDLVFDSTPAGRYRRSVPARFLRTQLGLALVMDYLGPR
jgi:hypothetical protein